MDGKIADCNKKIKKSPKIGTSLRPLSDLPFIDGGIIGEMGSIKSRRSMSSRLDAC
jgi:hypothetical protein